MFVRRLGARRGVIAGGVAVALLAGGATFAWSSTREAEKPTCSLDVPARVVVNQPYLTPPVRRGADCAAAGVVEARWDAYTADGTLVHQLIFRWDYPDRWNVFDSDKRGPWTWRPTGATTDLETDRPLVPQNTPVSDLRLGSTAYLTSRRDGRRITLSAHIGRYDVKTAATESWSGARGELQLREPGNTVWTTFKHVTADSRGEATEAFDLAARFDYRLVVPDTADTWGSTSSKVEDY
ncbi:hypothetical protein ACQPXM_12490 [Kribbella sp. CA-253562]|uniref:hypothetical protein n=1 Tax=Kribbella sp. CA-253562 TaxID=3239942 RepID=UPI003D8A30C0